MTYLAAGLGNIGAEYLNTRHNMGFMVLDAFAKASNAVFVTERYGDVAKVQFRGNTIVLLKPSTYMNLSGKAVRYWMQELKLPVERVLVICDDLNLPFGSVRMRASGSDGGHNGLKNIAELLGSTAYPRIRMGIGNDFSRGGQIDFVLGTLSEDELSQMEALCARACDGIRMFVLQGVERAMNSVNSKKAPVTSGLEDGKEKA